MIPRRFKYGKYGLTENPIGCYVAITLNDRQFLGEVTGTEYNYTRGALLLTVRHFNGEPWPFQPVASAVEVVA